VRIWRIRDGFSKLLEDNSASFFSSVKFNPDGGYIAAGNGDGMLRIWNVRTSRLVEKWTAHGNVVRSVAFTLDGKGLVSSSADYTWKYWDISSISLAEPGYGTTKGSVVGQKSKVAAHTLVRHPHIPVQRFLLTQAPFISAYRTMSVPFPSLLMVNGLLLAQVFLLCVSGTCAMPPCSAH